MILTPRQTLNKAYLKVKPSRNQIEGFKTHLKALLVGIDDAKREEYHKTLLTDFLKKAHYDGQYFVNVKDDVDLAIYNGQKSDSAVAVLLEIKKPSNAAEMPKVGKLNSKALQELVLYYLRERITHNNLEVKHLIITNIREWFVFDAQSFDRLFAQNKGLVKQFTDFEAGRLSESKTDFFYKQIAEPFIANLQNELPYTWFELAAYEKALRNADKTDDNKLISLYKLLSPEHLLKLPFANDSNSLDKRFYSELLHIIGLTEVKDGGKKLIQRNKSGERHSGSLLEDAIIQLDSLDKLSRLDRNGQAYGANTQDRLFNVALELVITWVNRILFLKLLEAQLLRYQKGDKSYAFLNSDKIKSYDDLNSLFFQVLARSYEERNDDVAKLFDKVPYLNSSLFEPTELEQLTLFISNLRDDKQMPVHSQTVLKDEQGRKRTGSMGALAYLFAFLDAYDFGAEGSEDIQEDNKTLINASVLGLIFEKINGYKDGSFFTPGFITMYMCRETIRKAVLQKFKEVKGWECDDITGLYNKIDDLNEANSIVNSIKICDPAVGSGHFLVSALNEMIAVKNDLKILQDRNGRRLKEYQVEVVNDELIVTDSEGELFEYNPRHAESQRIQETLFHEKQTIIENCLFGVDINPNSVKICRLRLWIELLKNAYYKTGGGEALETLPNIDINIKTGNSLVSRFALDADLKQALRKGKFSVDAYRVAVATYRNAQNKDQKREMERLIASIKSDFRSEITANDPKMKRLQKLEYDYGLLVAPNMFREDATAYGNKANQKKAKERESKMLADINKLKAEIEEIKANKIYENAFEWRFEFPEVLNDEGDFVGFDVVIGNPPYIRHEEIKDLKTHFKSQFKLFSGTADLYIYFIERGFHILKTRGVFTYIMPNKFMQAGYGKLARGFLLEQNLIEIIDFGDFQVFEEATTYPCVLTASKESPQQIFRVTKVHSADFNQDFPTYVANSSNEIQHKSLNDETWVVSNSQDQELLRKVISVSEKLEVYIKGESKRGVLTGLTEAFVIDQQTKDAILSQDSNAADIIKPFLLGRNVSPYGSGKHTHYLILIPKGFTIKRNLPPDDVNFVSEPQPRYGNMEFDDAWFWFRNRYPSIAEHLYPFRSKAEVRTDKGDFWWELRACDYYDKFEKPKIMYQVLQVKPCFIYDDKGMYCNNSMWFIPSDDKVLLGILNSRMGWWLISKYCSAIQNGYQLIWKYFSQIPIANGEQDVRNQIAALVNNILMIKDNDTNADTTALEAEINQLVYALYGLTEEEIKIVEGV